MLLRHIRTDEPGVVYVEFLLVIIPFLILFFGLTQLGLIYGADLMVRHAANKAVRAAIVILPDDHEEADYGDVPLNQIGDGGDSLDTYANAPDDGRLAAIRQAPKLILSAISPSIDSYTGSSLADAIGESQLGTYLAGLLWTEAAMVVTFPDGKDGYRGSFGSTEMITARVTFLYKCSVPMVNRLMCSSWFNLDKKHKNVLKTAGKLLPIVSTISGWQVIALEAERTLPNQGK